MRKKSGNDVLRNVLICLALILLVAPAMAATTNLTITKYANDGTTILNQTTKDYTWLEAHLPVQGDGVTHYFHQGPTFNDSDPYDPGEYQNVLTRDFGAVKGTDVRDLAGLVGGAHTGDTFKFKAADGMTVTYPYEYVYTPDPRQGPMVITWYNGEESNGEYENQGVGYPPSYFMGMRLIMFADNSSNPWGYHVFGDNDMLQVWAPQYRYNFSMIWPSSGGISEKYVRYVNIMSQEPVPVVPTANFTSDVQSGTAPITVHFTDTSTGSPTSWAWDFNGDGGIDSILQNPEILFTDPGTYPVNLTVTNTVGSDFELKTDYIVVSPAATLPVLNVNTAVRYATIQAAVTAATAGDEIVVSDGSYTENVVIDKSITIRSENGAATTTVAAATSTVPVFDVNAADFVTIDGFSVTGATGSNIGGIDFTDSDSGVIIHNIVSGSYNGIHLGGTSTNNSISYNNCHDNSKRGLSMRNDAFANYAFRNTFSANTDKDICIKDTTHDNVIWLNNLLGGTLDIGTANTENSPAPITYTYGGGTYTSYLGNYYSTYAGADADGNGVGDTAFASGSYWSDSYPLMGQSANYVETALPPAPVAVFSADHVSGTAPLTVQFTDASTGTPTSWAWDFTNDGTVDSTEQSPSHIYDTAGTYTVNLTVTNAGGSDSEVKTDYITVTAAGPKTWYVDDSGGADFTTIQAAIDASSAGDTISIRAGSYGKFTPTKSDLSIVGEGSDYVIVDVAGVEGINIPGNEGIPAPRTILEGITVINSPSGVRLGTYGSAEGSIIRNCVFKVTSYVNLQSTDGKFENNTITLASPGTSYAISMKGAQNFTVANNRIENFTPANGVILITGLASAYTTNNTISNNLFVNCSGNGIYFNSLYQNNNTVAQNTFAENGIYLRNSGENNRIFLNSNLSGVTLYGTAPAITYWNSTTPITYTYNGASHTGYPGNFWSSYTGSDADGNGIIDTPNVLPSSLGTDYEPLMGAWNNGEITYTPPTVIVPVAAFISDIQTGTAPLTVNFTDQSTNTPTSWAWDFTNDGTVDSTEPSPSHIYDTAGTYTVNLTVTNAGGSDDEVKTDYITVTAAGPKTWFVDDSGGADFTTIQAAVAAAGAGDTIIVRDGTYIENVIIDNYITPGSSSSGAHDRTGLTLRSENGADTTIVQSASASLDVIYISASWITIDGFHVTETATSPAKSAIHVYGALSSYCTIINNECDGKTYGINIDTSAGWNTIRNNRVTYAGYGTTRSAIYLTTTNNNTVINNTCWKGDTVNDTVGIYICATGSGVYSKNNTLQGNTIDVFAKGITLQKTRYSHFYQNTISNNSYGIYFMSAAIGNTFDLNNFIGNTAHVGVIDLTTVMSNSWNSAEQMQYSYDGSLNTGYLGNYWSGYSGADSDCNGIGDTAYLAHTSADEFDNYPLMGAWDNGEITYTPPAVIAPVAAFTSDVQTGDAPLTVQFTDQSTNTPTSWAWDFDNDGTVDSTEQSPSHIYDTAGTYTVNLTVTNAVGSDSEVKTDFITVSPPTPALLWGPYLTGTTTTGTVVNAKTSIATAVSVEYATDAYYTANSGYDQSATDSVTDTLHHVSLAGLTPDTLYHYRVVYAGQPTGDLHFSTFPVSGAFTFVVYGDTQDQLPTYSQLERHKLVADRIAEEPDVAFVLNSGDLVNDASDLANWDRYFAAGSMMMANTTVYPALGNHDDNNANYYQNYGVPEYYSFDIADAHVAVLDSNDWANYEVEGTWLANDLQTDKQFKFVSFHHPLYTSESNHFGGWTNLKEAWESDINDNGVLAVFNGHIHAYERLFVNDTNYFVAGIGGGPSYNLATPRYAASQNSLEYMIGYIRVTVDPAARTATAQVIRVADVSTDLKTLTNVYPAGTVFETVVMSLPELPVANFTATPLTGTAPLAVQFTDTSTGTPISWAWDFDNDGTVDSTEPSPSHIYDTAGTYTVNLTVTNAEGSDSEVKAGYVSVTSVPVVDILYDGPVTLANTNYTQYTYLKTGASYNVSELTPLGALHAASLLEGFTYDVTDKKLSSDGVMLLDNIRDPTGAWTYNYTSVKNGTTTVEKWAWTCAVNGEILTDSGTTALNTRVLTDGDSVLYYYGNTMLSGYTADDAVAKIILTVDEDTGVDVIYNGPVTLSDGTYSQYTYLKTGASYDVSELTPLGALHAASLLEGFTYDVTDKKLSSDGVMLLDNIRDP
ncbi:MAG: PKD domain-containing protein, partial [Methanoregula sp.]|nr:PKD domain-containing protein [Methanoregula sp.]